MYMYPKYPEIAPIYKVDKSYLENAEEGPYFYENIPERKVSDKKFWGDFLGFKVASKIGVPAGPLLNSRWVALAASLGFDIVTYKTIRSAFHPAHPVPNMVYVDCDKMLRSREEGSVLFQKQGMPKNMQTLGVTNSFGIPSRDPDFVIKDIAKAKKSLKEGQVMIVSFVGTPRKGEDESEDFAYDFVKAALLAKQGGANIIEADFSCPNVKSKEGSIHKCPQTIFTISSAIKKEIPDLSLIIKVGAIDEEKLLKEVMVSAARAGVEAICGINTLSMQVLTSEHRPALGEGRLRAGICGAPIRNAALDFVKMAASINRKEKLGLTIMGTGGVVEPEHFDLFFDAGADVAMTAVGMMYDPFLGIRYHGK